ncbi:hypothetical protein NXW78_28390 [Bacteroides ovatus]|nr:hypothetical protein [Bacteroides ovatus]
MKPTINQTLLSDVYSIIHLGRRWIDGTDFVTQEQQKQIIEWVDMIQDCFYYPLEGDIGYWGVLEYEEYKIDNKESYLLKRRSFPSHYTHKEMTDNDFQQTKRVLLGQESMNKE